MGFFTASHLKKMKQSFRAKQLQKAVSYAEKIDPAEVRTAYDLSMMADIYMCAEDYESAKKVYAVMFSRNKSARTCKQLIKLCIMQGKVKEALQYIKELKKIDDEDYERFIFQYQIGQKLGQEDDYLLACLLKVREADYIDIWALELAKLYYKMGKIDECISECRNIKLWFPETEYAYKANALLEACANGTSYEEAMAMINESAYQAPAENYEAVYETPYEETGEAPYAESSEAQAAYYDAQEAESYESAIANSINDYVDEEAAEEPYFEDSSEDFDDDYDSDDDEISMEEYLALKAKKEALEVAASAEAPEASYEEEPEEYEEEFSFAAPEEAYEEEYIEPEELENSDSFEESEYYEENEEPYTEDLGDEFIEEEFDEEEYFDDDDDEASEEEIQAMLARKKAMAAESEKSESVNRVELTTHTLVNDSLTSDVISALLEQEKLGKLDDDDAVEESIMRMIEEDD